MKAKTLSVLLLAITFFISGIRGQLYQGKWKLLKKNIGILAMHMQLLPNDKMSTFDWMNLSDGRVLVGVNNPNRNHNYSALFSTELRLEAISPLYHENISWSLINEIKPEMNLGYKRDFLTNFQVNNEGIGDLYVTMVAPSLTTRSFSMNQRLLVLDLDRNSPQMVAVGKYVVGVNALTTAEVVPSGYYQLFMVHESVGNRGMCVHIK